MRVPDLLPPFDLVQNTLSIHSLIYHAIYVGLCLYYAGFVSSTFVPDNEGVTLDELGSLTLDSPGEHGDPDVLGSSQLGGALLEISQQQTPQPPLCPERQVRSPDHHTYSEGHVHAQQRAKRVRWRRGG